MPSIPKGFKASATICGLKRSGKPDIALIYSEVPAVCAGVFTSNKVKAAPILVSMQQIKSGKAQAIIANAGNANACTGSRGLKDAWTMVLETAKALKIPSSQVLVTSTGVIGVPLPMAKVKKGIIACSKKLTKSGLSQAARAIMTTDLIRKEVSVKVGGATIYGMAKGSGMIHPNMGPSTSSGHATMHAFILTDAVIDQKTLQKILKDAVDKSFNMVTVDQCMSTNDCVFALANAKVKNLSRENRGMKNVNKFKAGFEKVCIELAKMIAADGEGATKLIEVRVEGARSEKDAKEVALEIAGSPLMKAAVYGNDKNWGRIMQAVGQCKAEIDPEKIKHKIVYTPKVAYINVDLGQGQGQGVAWGCDLTEGYVKINARYHT